MSVQETLLSTLDAGKAGRGVSGGLGYQKGNVSGNPTTAAFKNIQAQSGRKQASYHTEANADHSNKGVPLPDNNLYRDFTRGPVLGKMKAADITKDDGFSGDAVAQAKRKLQKDMDADEEEKAIKDERDARYKGRPSEEKLRKALEVTLSDKVMPWKTLANRVSRDLGCTRYEVLAAIPGEWLSSDAAWVKVPGGKL